MPSPGGPFRESHALYPFLGLDPVPDLGYRPGGNHKLQPILAGMVSRLGDNFDRIAVLQLIFQRYDVPVTLAPMHLLPTSVWML